jgi:hypothetical protein
MAKLKKPPGRLIGRWKEEAISANSGASDEDLAKIVNDTAKAQGYDYTISPDKVRTRKKKAAHRPAPAAVAAPSHNSAPTKAAAGSGIALEDIRAIKAAVDRIGAEKVQELAAVLAT